MNLINKIGYLPALDGLRAIAIILVMLAHANFQLGSNGILGVDIFFALSGFLITTLLLEENEINGKVSLMGFYIRRTFRLFPALYLLLAVILLYALIIPISLFDKLTIFNEIKAAGLYVYNISWVWGWGAEGMVLGHTWSLAVEEQFYLIWPILLIAVLKFQKLKAFCYTLIVFILIVFILKINGRVSSIADALIHESIFIGCSAALVRWLQIFKMNLHISITIVLVVLIGFIGIFPETGYMDLFKQGGRSLIALVTVVIILDLVKNPSSLLSKALSHSMLVYVGKISYALYLWHVPVFRWFKWHSSLLPWQSFLLKIVVTFLIAAASFAIIENKSTKFGRNLSKKLIFKQKT